MKHSVPYGFLATELPFPVFRWKFSEGAGTSLADSSGNGYTGTLTTGTVWGTATIGGIANCSFAIFNGTSQLATSASAVSQLTGSAHASMSFWFIATSPASHLIAGAYTTANERFSILGVSGSTIYVILDNGTSESSPQASVSYYGAWHHLVFTFDGTQVYTSRYTLYLDGVSQSLTGFSSPVNTPTSVPSGIGNQLIARDISDGVYGAQGTTDYQLWTNTLTQAQVTALFKKGPQT
jgi:hypothetical protein